MPEIILKRLSNLLTVKSIVTIILTVVFAVLTCTHSTDQNFLTIYATIIAFYFGTQSSKDNSNTNV